MEEHVQQHGEPKEALKKTTPTATIAQNVSTALQEKTL